MGLCRFGWVEVDLYLLLDPEVVMLLFCALRVRKVRDW